MDTKRLLELAGVEQLNEGTTETAFVIKRADGGFVDKGGRKTMQLKNAFMWSTISKAEEFLSRGKEKIYVSPGSTLDGFKIVQITLTEGK